MGNPGHNNDVDRGRLRWWAALLTLAVVLLGVRPAVAADPRRDVLVRAGADWFWLAVVEPRDGAAPGEAAEQTRLRVRANKPLAPWRPLNGPLLGRAVALAAHDSQLAVLLADGRWLTVWPEGTATGQPLPADGSLRTLADDDGKTLWAIGSVPGGKATADAPDAATRPASSRPASAVPRLVVFRQTDGRWVAVADLPETVPGSADAHELSLAVADGVPLVAYRSAGGRVRTLAWTPGTGGGRWVDRGAGERPTTRPVVRFDLLGGSAATGPLLWTTAGAGDPGQVRSRAGPVDGVPPPDAPVSLPWPAGQPPLTGTPAVTVAGNYLRVVGPATVDGKAVDVDQRYGFDGQPVGLPAAVVVPGPAAPSLAFWAKVLLAVMLAFAVATSVMRQNGPAATAGADGAIPAATAAAAVVPAPLGRRAAAGAIDAAPVVVAAVVAAVSTGSFGGEMSPAMQGLLAAAVGLYLLHTAVLEGLTARSAGKWAMGLRVATVDGGRPTVGSLVGRNLLRAVDPLVFIALSPLRQRTADLLVGTVVVPATAAGAGRPPTESKG